MRLKEHVYSVLLVSSSEKLISSLRAILTGPDYSPVRVAGSVNEAQRQLQERAFDIVLIAAPLPDDFGSKLAIDVSLNSGCVVSIMVKSELYGETCSKVYEYGVFTMKMPTSGAMLTQLLDWMRATRERLRGLEKKTVKLEDRMSEIRIVNRAKWALIESLDMTEADAHRYIEKQAMDRCVTRREIAESILNTYK